MIAFLRGTIQNVLSSSVIVDVSGVGYEVFMTDKMCSLCATRIGREVECVVHHHIRDSALDLYGFESQEEKEMFCALLSISGIGPKVALSILNAAPLSLLKQAIADQDSVILTKVSGIGVKKAQKIILELKDVAVYDSGSAHDRDVIEALEGIGYSRSQIQRTLRALPDSAMSVEEKIKRAIQEMGKESRGHI
ncbi:MAG: Holliday junction branch migration protein RuvA [Candidatus Spechtbacteria bacterium SB0662_bin_43]|uniref:Holliday junction branch migration complex subunit RuvA n=1 Tax=Candidatus Spechtbacteria bacterium SB0662_bin_43 TaxID=2604897 RepID=A0A845DDP6_9BACT|nr:Holliday junction branch migration protein RuvA [Candidatus Spechtbacteria bacterium SB0662_bin_43]